MGIRLEREEDRKIEREKEGKVEKEKRKSRKEEKKMTKKTPTTTFCITGALEKYNRIDAIVKIHNKTKIK